MSDDTLRIATFNLKTDGRDQGRDDRRHAALEWLASLDLDAVLMQELSSDETRVQEVRDALGMRGDVARGDQPNHHTGVFLGEAFGGYTTHPHARDWHIMPADCTTFLQDTPKVPITFVSVHCAYYSASKRLAEVSELARIAEKAEEEGFPLICAGDWNELPMQEGEVIECPDYASIPLTVHRGYRARQLKGGSWSPITDCDKKLHNDLGLRDPAKHVAHTFNRPQALAATVGHARPDQGGPVRLDAFKISPWLTDFVTDVEVREDAQDFSDHRPVVMTVLRSGLESLHP